jgi:hypothetical protein
MADIFISYAREDEARIQHLASALEEQGWSVFWDRRIPAGQTWRSYIGHALRDAVCIVVAWSRHSVSSRWVIEEAEEGQQRGNLVPILLDPVEPPIGFRGIQAGDLTAWQPGHPSPHLSQLVQDINAVLGAGPTPPGAEGAVELDAESHRQRYELPKQQPEVLSRRLKNAILAVILVLVAGIIGYWGYDLTSFTSLPTRENEEVEDTTKDSASVELKGSSLTISGKGLDLYYVYDASGQKQLSYKSTGQIIELLPGTYQVALNKTWQSVTVQANRQTAIESGSLIVSGGGRDLYYVYDASGQKQLSYKSTGQIIELLPGTYQVELHKNRVPVQVRAKEKSTL